MFFFMQKTAYEMRISDWSSDVCSSYLHGSPSIRHGRHFIRPYPSLRPTLHLEICWWRQRRYPFSLHDLSLRDAWILRTMSLIQPGMAERAATSARVPASSRREAQRPITPASLLPFPRYANPPPTPFTHY